MTEGESWTVACCQELPWSPPQLPLLVLVVVMMVMVVVVVVVVLQLTR